LTAWEDSDNPGYFDDAFRPLVQPALDRLVAGLAAESGLGAAERSCVADAVTGALRDTVGRLLSRVLILELNAARVSGTLRGPDPAARWHEFIARYTDERAWKALSEHYPTMLDRVGRVIDNRCTAALAVATRFADDRALLPADGDLTSMRIGLGDSHDRGRTVDLLHCGDTAIYHKPRSLAVDAALIALLDDLRPHLPDLRIRVPAVIDRVEYGWAAQIEHRWCADDAELRAFYRGCGHWLAAMRLLGGGDLHGENLVASGPVPVVVDCETVIAPLPDLTPSGLGEANDRAAALITDSVLRVGLLPTRGTGLGWRGVDTSAVGGLPDQQPQTPVPMIIDGGLDTARMGHRLVDPPQALNHPHQQPTLTRFWGDVLAGFTELTECFVGLDRTGALEPMLDRFRDCRIRAVLRDTEVYAEHARMLWHPVSLHDEGNAVAWAADLLRTQGERSPGMPADPAVVAAEIAEMLDGDIPVFVTTPRIGRLTGPCGTSFGPAGDLVTAALNRWRGADFALERAAIRASLVGAYLNEGWLPDAKKLTGPPPRAADLDRRRRTIAARLVAELRDRAVRGSDGTASWIAPVLDATGWQVQTSGLDLYTGLPGIAVLLAGYRAEVAAGRADPVDGIDSLLTGVLSAIRHAEDKAWRERGRPEAPGGYIGIAGRIWSWLLLRDLGVADDGLSRASTLGALVPAAVEADEMLDVLGGMAGAIVPLTQLSRRTGQTLWTEMATEIGRRLTAAATFEDDTARWPTARWPRGLGGFAHGATGIGWALARLADETQEIGAADTGAAAFAYEETLYDAELGGWLDAREDERYTATAWCHGAGGVGIAAADLLRRNGHPRHREVLARAANAVWSAGLDWNHTLCHGDLGAWELLTEAIRHGVAPPGVDQSIVDIKVVSSLEDHGTVSGLANDAYSPGVLPGVGGIPYQLLRLHPDCTLPSLLTLDLP
jgi:type 2 lantibiotic biosynthesis protein LanM